MSAREREAADGEGNIRMLQARVSAQLWVETSSRVRKGYDRNSRKDFKERD